MSTPGGEPIVRVERLSKRFAVRRTWREMMTSPGGGARTTAVDAVSFSVGAGAVFGLLGLNGAGKTTIFKMLTTLLLPDGGTAYVMGHDVIREPRAVRRLIAPVIANERSVNWRLSARENIRLFTVLQGLRGAQARAEENRVLEVVGLTDTGAKLTGAFSTGMRQRLLLARALIGTPRVLLLDEPTRGLDPVSAREFRRFLRETVVAQQGCTVLLATHDADEVWELCDHVGVLDRGRLLATGATAELRQRVVGLRYRALVASSAPEAAIARARGAGFVLAARSAAGEVGWESLEFEVPSGLASAGQLLALLTVDGTQVASFEPVRASLAELIERVIHAQRPVADA